jgi:hypothetical protein
VDVSRPGCKMWSDFKAVATTLRFTAGRGDRDFPEFSFSFEATLKRLSR